MVQGTDAQAPLQTGDLERAPQSGALTLEKRAAVPYAAALRRHTEPAGPGLWLEQCRTTCLGRDGAPRRDDFTLGVTFQSHVQGQGCVTKAEGKTT